MSVKVQTSLDNLKKRIASLKSAITRYNTKLGTQEEEDYRELIIKRFESSEEVAKKLMKSYLNDVGEQSSLGAKGLFIKMNEYDFIDSDSWFDMNTDRNKTAHEYDEIFARDLVDKIKDTYLLLLENFYFSVEKNYK